MELDAATTERGLVLGVFHNRRLDADIQTLRQIVLRGRLGRLWRVHSRMDFDDPATLEAGPSGGLLRDLGSHLVDQMLWLLGPVRSVDAQLDFVDLPEGRTDASFTVTLRHASGTHSHISASKLNRLSVPEFRAYGDGGSFVASGTDVQAQAIFAGKRPADDLDGWGYDREEFWGTLRTASGIERIPSEQGRYHDYYEAFARAVHEGTSPPVTAEEAVRTLAMVGRTIEVEVPVD